MGDTDDEPLVSPPSHVTLLPDDTRFGDAPSPAASDDAVQSPVELAVSSSALAHTSVAVSRLKEHALASVRRADQLRHELVQRSAVELARTQGRSTRMEEIVETMVAAQNSYLQHLSGGGVNDGGGDEVTALAELHRSSERSITEMHEVFGAADSPTDREPDTSESRWQGHQERVRADLSRSKRLAARKNPVPKRTKLATPTSTADAEELEKAKLLAEERAKELARLKKALAKSQAEVARVTTELESTLEADVSKLETVHRQIGEQRKIHADQRVLKQLQTAQAMLEAEQLLHSATQREMREIQNESSSQISRLRNGLSVADVETSKLTDGYGASRAGVDRGGEDLTQMRKENEMLRNRERQAIEQRSSMEVQVNRLELELELAKINSSDGRADGTSVNQAATAHGSQVARREQSLLESTHLRKVIVRLEAEHGAQEHTHAREVAEWRQRLEAAHAEITNYQHRLDAAGAETASGEVSRDALRREIVTETRRYHEALGMIAVQRGSIKKLYQEVLGSRLHAFSTECMAQLREGGWLSKYADTTMKVKRVHVHVRDDRLYWGKKPGDISGSFVELESVRVVDFGHTESQEKHIRHNATVAPGRQRSVHAAWHCVTVRMADGKSVSLAGPMDDNAAVGAEDGCQDMMVWCAGLYAHTLQSGGGGRSIAVPSQGSLLWERCRMRVDAKAQARNTSRLSMVAAALSNSTGTEG